jgi:phenylalanyl-tRNA synthetase alpha chain
MKIYKKPISSKQLTAYLAIQDLTQNNKHAIGKLYKKIELRMRRMHQHSEIRVYRMSPIVSVADNYDNLLIPKDNISRSSTYTHYVNQSEILRTHTTAQIPGILRELSRNKDWDDVLILLPGLAYRRDVTDKKHVGQVHMLEMWRIVRHKDPITKPDLLDVVNTVSQVAAPGWKLRIVDSPHPYTKQGIEVNAVLNDRDIEILECG